MLTGPELAGCAKYLTDESRAAGRADAVALPASTAEVSAALALAAERGWQVTVSGARTGITAGAVPRGGLLLSLERMNRVLALRVRRDGGFAVRCQAGVPLSQLQRSLKERRFADSATWERPSLRALEALRQRGMFFPPDPTETSASLGGMVACNASGAHTFRYGPTRPYVLGLTVVLADGAVLDLRRGECAADARGRLALWLPDGSRRPVPTPGYAFPATKNAAGYLGGAGVDAVDLFVGSEGTLGVITEVDLRLIACPEVSSAQVIFLRDEAAALALTQDLRGRREALGVEAIEYFSGEALDFLRGIRRQFGGASGVPECLPAAAGCAIYLDLGMARADVPEALRELARRVEAHGADPRECWSCHETDARERLRRFRHALPEAVNARIAETQRRHPAVTKLGTDMAVPDEALESVVALYRRELAAAGLEFVIFGHIGDNHLHVNILPRTPDEYGRGRALYAEFARQVVAMGGSPVAEHGVGKLKTAFLSLLFGEAGVAQMRAVKAAFDPDFRLGPGTLFAPPAEG